MENEIDASTVYKQAANNIKTITNFNDSLNRFGYTKDDRIERHDMMIMYSTINKEMRDEITTLAHDSCYDSAKEMRLRLSNIKNEFHQLQMNNEDVIRQKQEEIFYTTQLQHLNEIKSRHANEEIEIQNYCQELRNDLAKTHEIELENFNLKLQRLKKLPPVYSKRLIELLKSESSLINLNEYDEARKVRIMIDRILPHEVNESNHEFQLKNQLKREKLLKGHCDDIARLDEKIKSIIWTDKRRREREYARELQRIKNHQKDMTHAHLLESKLKPEMSIKPSALWTKRPGYQATSASMRGSQFLNTVRGNHGASKVFADSLVDKHDFANPLSGTRNVNTR